MLKVAVVILNWNGKRFLEKFLPSLVASCPEYADIFVADNGSIDGSKEFLSIQYPSIHFIDFGTNYGYTGGYNRALRQIAAEYYILLNSDIEVESGWIEPVIELMDADKSIAACQPKIKAYHQKDSFEYAGAAGGFIDQHGYPFCQGRIFDHLETDQGQYNNTIDIFWATGACMFVRAVDFKLAGALDEDFFAHMEEIDLCWRLKRLGKRIVYCPQSTIYHIGGGTLPKNNPRKTFLNFRNNLLLLAKNLPAHKYYIILAKRLVLDMVAALKFLINGHLKDTLAVFQAYFSVFGLIRKKRKEGKTLPYLPVTQVYKSSIVFEYYIRGKKKFTDLDSSKFGEH